jgi:hypothetical protein
VAKRPKDHRKCVGIVLLNSRNEAFVARRADGALNDKGDDGLASGSSLWQFPQARAVALLRSASAIPRVLPGCSKESRRLVCGSN